MSSSAFSGLSASAAFLDRYQPVAADPDQARGLRPLHDPVAMCEVLARPCLEDPPADVRVDRVAGIEQFHEAAGVRQADAPGRGELAPRTSQARNEPI